jgi:hypothetical protein
MAADREFVWSPVTVNALEPLIVHIQISNSPETIRLKN